MTIHTREDIKLSNAQIAWRAAQDIEDGAYVNLGIGFPEMVARYQPPGRQAIFHTENGILDFGEAPPAGEEDWDLINAGKKAVTLKPGAAFFHHADSFAMVRGGHVDLTILGALQVDREGNLANWMIPGKMVKGMGGAMDLVAGVKRVIVLMEHVARKKDGSEDFKIIPSCTLPLTGVGVVDRIITDLGVFDVVPGGIQVVELAEGVTREFAQSKTGVPLW